MVCAFTILSALFTVSSSADEVCTDNGRIYYEYARILNDAITEHGAVSTDAAGGSLTGFGYGSYPQGIIYADTVSFENDEFPCLIIFRADGRRERVYTDIYNYNEQANDIELITSLEKAYNTDPGVVGELCLGVNENERYIVYNEYTYDEKTNSEYYTVKDDTAFVYINSPNPSEELGIVSYNSEFFRPEVDVSEYNKPLESFFARIKNKAGDSVTYTDIVDRLTVSEEERLETVMADAAKFNHFDIGEHAYMADYRVALDNPDADHVFYLMTNVYDLGDEIFYIRFATNRTFYNYAMLRRTSANSSGYQLLCVRSDSIPLTDYQLGSLKNAYMHNKLLAKKARGSISLEHKPLLSIDKKDGIKAFTMPKLFKSDLRVPVGISGGVICLSMLIFLWFYLAYDED